MKDPEEIRRAIATLGGAVQDPEFQDYMWGGPATEASTRAMFMLLALGWVMDVDPQMFDGILVAIEGQRIEYLKEKELCLKQMYSNHQQKLPSSKHPRSN